MEYTSNLFVKFIEELIDYSRACKLARESAAERKRNRKDEERKAWNVERAAVDQRLKKYVSEADHIYWEVRDREKTTAFVDLKRKEGIFERLHKCKRLLAEITNAENSILNREGYDANKMKSSSAVQASVDELLEGKIDFISMAYFYQKIAFDMSKEDFSQFVGVNDSSQMSENMAVYNNKMDDNTNFRPYQSPDVSWVKEICEKLK